MGFVVSQAIFAVTRLGVVEALRAGPSAVRSLADRTGAEPDALERFLRLLAGEGLFAEGPAGVFALTEVGSLLAAGVPGSLRHLATNLVDEVYRAWGGAEYSLRTGKPAFDEVFGDSWFGWLAERPELSAAFNATQAGLVERRGRVLLDQDWAGVGSVVDVGGGSGALLGAVLSAHPRLRGVLFDQPRVVAEAVLSPGVADRCEVVGGDFFTSVPGGGDVYVIAQILHDWSDEDAGRILSRVREAMGDDARLLILEHVLPDGDHAHPGRLLDLNMLVLLGGRERSTSDWRALLTTSGFDLVRVVPGTRSSLLEAVPRSVRR